MDISFQDLQNQNPSLHAATKITQRSLLSHVNPKNKKIVNHVAIIENQLAQFKLMEETWLYVELTTERRVLFKKTTCAQRSLFLNNTRAIASVLFRNNAQIRVAKECVILKNAQVQEFIPYKTRRTTECSGQQCNDVMISLIC